MIKTFFQECQFLFYRACVYMQFMNTTLCFARISSGFVVKESDKMRQEFSTELSTATCRSMHKSYLVTWIINSLLTTWVWFLLMNLGKSRLTFCPNYTTLWYLIPMKKTTLRRHSCVDTQVMKVRKNIYI